MLLSNHSGIATACNEGAKQARGKYLLFFDAYTKPTPDWIKNLRKPFVNDKIGIGDNLSNIGNLFYVQGIYKVAADYFFKSLKTVMFYFIIFPLISNCICKIRDIFIALC